MWDGCVVTKFANRISAADMTKDIWFTWKPFEAYQQHVFTTQGARDTILTCFVLVVGAWGMISMCLFRNRIRQPHGVRWYFCRALLPVVAILVLCAGIWFVSAPTLDASEVQVGRMSYYFPWHVHGVIQEVLTEHPDVLQGTDRQITAYLLKEFAARYIGAKNWLAGVELQIEDSPGNFTVEKQSKNVIIRVYDHSGGVLVKKYVIPDREEKAVKP